MLGADNESTYPSGVKKLSIYLSFELRLRLLEGSKVPEALQSTHAYVAAAAEIQKSKTAMAMVMGVCGRRFRSVVCGPSKRLVSSFAH
jgi:hypothetical protein